MSRMPSHQLEGAIFSAAEAILSEQGTAGLTVRNVAARAQIAPMGVYNRYDGKQGLLEALFCKGFEDLRTEVARAVGGDAKERLRDAALRYRQFALDHPQHYSLMFEHMSEVSPGEEALQLAFAAFDELVTMVASVQEGGSFGTGDAVDVAQQWWNALHGAVSLELLGIGFAPDPAASFERMVDALLLGLDRGGH